MSKQLLSVGLDVGTTSTQMVVSELTVENAAGSFSVPELKIAERRIRYRSPVYFTPLLDESHVDGNKLRHIVENEYEKAGITRQVIDTGAVIITGETSRKENAAAVLESLSEYAGDFVVATAGPDLESVLAAKGAGAVAYSEKTGRRVLHMDIGGGTANLAWIDGGHIVSTGCLNVGGRLLKIGDNGVLSYVSPVISSLFQKKPGETVTKSDVAPVVETLAQVLEMAAGLRTATPLLEQFQTDGSEPIHPDFGKDAVISFSGGVADCIGEEKPWLSYGDIGPELGTAIRGSLLCRGEYRLGQETIRATVIGAGSYSAQLSGSTVYYRNVEFPMKNLPVVTLPERWTPEEISRRLSMQDGQAVLALPGKTCSGYEQMANLADMLAAVLKSGVAIVTMEQDMGKVLGQLLALRMGSAARILSIDRVQLSDGCYLDVGEPVGPALPVVVKTLALRNSYR